MVDFGTMMISTTVQVDWRIARRMCSFVKKLVRITFLVKMNSSSIMSEVEKNGKIKMPY